MRDTTERPEAILAGTVKLVGTNIKSIVDGVANLLDNKNEYDAMSLAHNPYGDGFACRIIHKILNDEIQMNNYFSEEIDYQSRLIHEIA
jgi:UDP-N-acetylglucosamine 2-epimerase (non-hydrolysing)